MKRSILHPRHPERVCWGCDRFCSASDLGCGNGKDRVQHPVEVLGEDWQLAWPDLAKEGEPHQPGEGAPAGTGTAAPAAPPATPLRR